MSEALREQVDEVVRLWNLWIEHNGFTGQVRRIRSTSPRWRRLKARLEDPEWLPRFRMALTRALESPFLMGRTPNCRWPHMDFDFIIRPDSVDRILEGRYDAPRA